VKAKDFSHYKYTTNILVHMVLLSPFSARLDGAYCMARAYQTITDCFYGVEFRGVSMHSTELLGGLYIALPIHGVSRSSFTGFCQRGEPP
jgi:hypothetical protein